VGNGGIPLIFWPLAVSSWGKEELAAMENVIKSGFFSMGQLTKKFEEEFASWAGSKYALMVNSGSSANLIAVSGLRYVRDEEIVEHKNNLPEVIVPAVSWSTTFFPFFQNRYKLVFIDVDKNTFNINADKIEAAITKSTVGICAVNLLGSPADWDKINEIAATHGLWIFEDNCESMGATLNKQKTGTFGDVGTFSFFFSHHICTMEGGMIVCDDEELYLVMRSLRAHGWSREIGDSDTFRGEQRGSAWEENFRFYLPGYNVRPLEMSAAVGLEQLKKFDSLLELRKRNANLLLTRLQEIQTDWQLQEQNGQSSWFTFGFINRNSELGPERRHRLIKLMDEHGIQSRPIVAGDFTRNPVYKYLVAEISGNLHSASLIHDSGFMVGNHHLDLSDQINTLCRLLVESER
jgi:CDP-6-deoxy-D-xylo-4-hexulose-3-dehydrase